jgi:hypothetical protein
MRAVLKTKNKLLPSSISEAEMATDVRSTILTIAVVALVLAGLYLIDPTFFGLLGRREGFESTMGADSTGPAAAIPSPNEKKGQEQAEAVMADPNSAGGDATSSGVSGFTSDISGSEGFSDLNEVSGPASFGSAGAPAGCYPRDQLTPGELLPKDQNSVWAQQNPMGTGSLKGKNFLSAGSLIGINTVGQSLRNANYQLRSEPPNPQVPVSVFNNSTIEPDTNRRDMEIN